MWVKNLLCLVVVTSIVSVVISGAAYAGGETKQFGPLPYLSRDDSPFNMPGLGSTFFVEDFEDGLLNAPGIGLFNPTDAVIVPPGDLTDSVDADDGIIDGSGITGYSYLASGAVITFPVFVRNIDFTFDAEVLGFLPTAVGVVWTDGPPGSKVAIVSWDADGDVVFDNFVGTFEVGVGDDHHDGGTSEDRFFGIRRESGIARIGITTVHSFNSAGFEIDHVQYGLFVPESSAANLFVPGLACLILLLSRTSDASCGGMTYMYR